MISAERLKTLRQLCTDPVEYGTAEYEAVRGQLANSVPELLDTIASLLEAVRQLAPSP